MGKKQTDSSRYPSRYSPGGFVQAAQYIVELICENQAAWQKRELPIKFWNVPYWQKFFRLYCYKVHALLKQYDEKAIIHAVQKHKVCTPHNENFEQYIQEEVKLLSIEKVKDNISEEIVRPTEIVLPKQRIIKNKLTILDE